MKDLKWTHVDLKDELTANTDGMPVFRRCFEHEILLSFNNDVGAYAFHDFWADQGEKAFDKYFEKNKIRYVDEA